MKIAFLLVAAFVAGVINSIAGGGTLLSFPALIFAGVNPIAANATNTVALWPGSLAGVLGFRQELRTLPRWLFLLMIPALIGGALGAWILMHTSSQTFSRIVPWLIFTATALLAFQEVIARRFLHDRNAGSTASPGAIAGALSFQLVVAIYGGYFGAGIGILMLAALGFIGMRDIHQMNGLKNLLAIVINGIAAIYFAVCGAVVWHDAAIMAVASIAGGYSGAKLARRIGKLWVRRAVVAIGLSIGLTLLLRR